MLRVRFKDARIVGSDLIKTCRDENTPSVCRLCKCLLIVNFQIIIVISSKVT